MDSRENYLRAVRFERPDWIPMVFYISPACWRHYETSALEDLIASHPRLFDGADPTKRSDPGAVPPWQQAQRPFSDPWGCVWSTREEGMTGTVVRHPLADWSVWETYRAPDPARSDGMLPVDWTVVAETFRRAAAQGRLCEGGLRHGHTFQRLSYLRGYENLIFDMADQEPRLSSPIEAIEDFNAGIVGRYLQSGAEVVPFPEDLGMQQGPMLSPGHFRRYIKPSYQRLMGPVREAGAVVHVHSDGDLRALADDLMECPLDVLNLQDLVNGLDWIRARLKGRVCIDLDIDRQSITRFGTPAEIDGLIRREVSSLGSAEGGLMMIYGLYPGVPLDNVRALAQAMDRYATHFS